MAAKHSNSRLRTKKQLSLKNVLRPGLRLRNWVDCMNELSDQGAHLSSSSSGAFSMIKTATTAKATEIPMPMAAEDTFFFF